MALNDQIDPEEYPQGPPDQGGSPVNEFDLGLLVYMARKSLIWVIVFFLIALTGVKIYLHFAQPIFEAYTVIQIASNNRAQKLGIDDIYEAENISTEIELLRSKEFFQRVLETLPLEVRYFTLGEVLTSENYTSTVFSLEIDSIYIPQAYHIDYFVSFPSPDKIKISYQNNLNKFENIYSIYGSIETPHLKFRLVNLDYPRYQEDREGSDQSELFFTVNKVENLVRSHYPFLDVRLVSNAAKTVRIGFEDNNPVKAKEITAALANEFKVYDTERKGGSAKKVLNFIDERLGDVYADLKSSETQLQLFKKEGKISGKNDFTAVFIERLNDIEGNIIDLGIQERIFVDIEKTIHSNDLEVDIYKLLPLLNSIKFDPNLSAQVQGLHKMLTEKERMFFQVTPQSAEIEAANYRIEIEKTLVLQSILNLRTRIQSELAILKERKEEIQSSFLEIPEKELEFAKLKRVFDINEKFYTLLLEKRTEYSISEAGLVSEHRILERASVPSIPIFPNRSISFVTAFALAILISILLIVVRFFMHNDITNLQEIVNLSRSNVSILGMIPKYKKDIPVSQLLVDKRPKSMIAESFRTVRTNLQFIANDKESRIIAVTSTISGEGKTFVAINLGGIIAFSGKKVIILDLDMRKPKIHLGFNAQNDVGMSTLLIGKNEIHETVKTSDLKNLSFITAGPIPPNPSELIISGKLDQILDKLKEEYDIIIMDNPPVGLVTDGIYCIQKADYPIYIFRSEYSKRQFVQNIDHLMNENKIRNLSVILNGVDLQRSGYGYNNGYGSGYGYGYRYGYGYQYGYGSQYGYGYYEEAKSEKKAFWKRIFSRKKDK